MKLVLTKWSSVPALIMLPAIFLGCYPTTTTICSEVRLTENASYGYWGFNQGIWLKTGYYFDEVEQDTFPKWILAVRNPKAYRFNNDWLIAKTDKRYSIYSLKEHGLILEVTYSRKSKIDQKFGELNIPDSLRLLD